MSTGVAEPVETGSIVETDLDPQLSQNGRDNCEAMISVSVIFRGMTLYEHERPCTNEARHVVRAKCVEHDVLYVPICATHLRAAKAGVGQLCCRYCDKPLSWDVA